MRLAVLLAGAFSIVACTKPNPNYCSNDTDCVSSTPFCDVAGEFDESDHQPHTCTVRPMGCAVERCGCEPGASVLCASDAVEICNADGRSTSLAGCPLGCADEIRCFGFEPSNGLGPALTGAADEADVILPPGAEIDTDLGIVKDAGGMAIEVSSVTVAQPGTAGIRAFVGRSFVLDSTNVRGTRAFAVVASGSIVVRGLVDASGSGTQNGPGAQDAPLACSGEHALLGDCGTTSTIPCGPGAGGGGNSTVGGAGGHRQGTPTVPAGGTAQVNFEPLVGGCRGGAQDLVVGGVNHVGGGGGGGVQLVSGESITLTGAGTIDLGAGGGPSSAGGGSGGTLVLEAPQVRLMSASGGVAANGGAGGGCDQAGLDATPTLTPAAAPQCSASAGAGATVLVAPAPGAICTTCIGPPHGGGGGALGRVRVATRTGEFEAASGALMSAVVTRSVLLRR